MLFPPRFCTSPCFQRSFDEESPSLRLHRCSPFAGLVASTLCPRVLLVMPLLPHTFFTGESLSGQRPPFCGSCLGDVSLPLLRGRGGPTPPLFHILFLSPSSGLDFGHGSSLPSTHNSTPFPYNGGSPLAQCLFLGIGTPPFSPFETSRPPPPFFFFPLFRHWNFAMPTS